MPALHNEGKLHVLDKWKLTLRRGRGSSKVRCHLLGAKFQHVKSCKLASISAILVVLS